MASWAQQPQHAAGTHFGVIRDARRRQRRRRALALLAVLAVAAIAVGIAARGGGGGTGSERAAAGRSLVAVPAARVLARPSFMGVACPVANSIACDRVGVAVWLRRPALAVSAVIGGRAFQLDDPDWGGQRNHGTRRMFAGFLHHAGLAGDGPLAVVIDRPDGRWLGSPALDARVRLLITAPDRSRMTTTVRVGLGPGWG